jgi:hypothetical protein
MGTRFVEKIETLVQDLDLDKDGEVNWYEFATAFPRLADPPTNRTDPQQVHTSLLDNNGTLMVWVSIL